MTAETLLAVPRIVARNSISVIVADVDHEDDLDALRWIAPTQLPALVLVTANERLPPLAARSRGAAIVTPSRSHTLAAVVQELRTARARPFMSLPLRLPQMCEIKWIERLGSGSASTSNIDVGEDTWPGDAAA